jgi:hypothetical protein
MDVDVHIQLEQRCFLRQLHAWHNGSLRHGGLNSSFILLLAYFSALKIGAIFSSETSVSELQGITT